MPRRNRRTDVVAQHEKVRRRPGVDSRMAIVGFVLAQQSPALERMGLVTARRPDSVGPKRRRR